nr:hypothetical protein BaRGS_013912 [Batillaria attramentaria]
MSPTFQWLIRWGCLAVMSLAVLLHIVGMSVAHWLKIVARPEGNGLYASRYLGKVTTVLDIWQAASSFMYPPSLDWAFGFGAAAATLMGGTGIILLAFITRTYPAYHRTENVVV